MDSLKKKFDSIEWPEEFIVEFKDGEEQIFVSSQGIFWDGGGDLEGKNEGRANITCAWKKKSPSQQKYRMIQLFLNEVKRFKRTTNDVIWDPCA